LAKSPPSAEPIYRLCDRSEAARQAVITLIESLAEQKKSKVRTAVIIYLAIKACEMLERWCRIFSLWRLARRHQSWLKTHDHGWGTLGFAFVRLGYFGLGIKAMADWRERSGLKMWMLLNLAIALRRIEELQKAYPKHVLIQQWKSHFEEVQAKIDPNAQRSLPFGPECPWDEANFAQLWVNLHWVKLLVDEKDWNHAGPLLSNIRDNEAIMLRPDRMKDYPADLRQWVIESKPEADKLTALVRQKTGAR